MRILIAALSITLINTMAGCSTKDSMIPVPDRNMKAVYDEHMNGIGNGKVMDSRSIIRRPMVENDVELSRYVRTEKNHLESKFKTIPNPTLYMYVNAHLASKDQVPIPGYLTEFKMWERIHYALPGEISDMDSQFKGNQK